MPQKTTSDTEPKANAQEPIKFETIYPIHIRKKDGALAFDPPGDTVVFEDNDNVKIALLAHKLNDIIIQLHRMQKAVFANVNLTASQQRQFNALTEAVDALTGVGNEQSKDTETKTS